MARAVDCVVDYDADVPCVVMTWTGYTPGAPFRAANEQVLAAIVEQRASRILGDIEAVRISEPADQRWLAEDWLPRAAAAGLRHAALVTPAFDLQHAPVRIVGEALPAGLELEYFDDAAAARAWLRSR
ncbi:MAG TPA: STAS/SEC14 domain-containing protein [Caulobacteraceae bacterium]